MIEELPLFPLSTVLYPRTLLPLFVFENRYLKLINYCISTGSPFGVVLIKEGVEVGGSAIPYEVGTEAKIIGAQKLPGGNYKVVVRGGRRFRVNWLDYSLPYLQAEVEHLEDLEGEPGVEEKLKHDVEFYFRKYLGLLEQLGINPLKEEAHHCSPEEYSYIVADTLQIAPREKQHLLVISSAAERLKAELEFLIRILDHSDN
jgi:Lon protease-like protein